MSPSRAPPGDAINRCRDAVDSIQSATSHKYSRDKAELVHLLGSPHIQVSAIFYGCQRALLLRRVYLFPYCHQKRQNDLIKYPSCQKRKRWIYNLCKKLCISTTLCIISKEIFAIMNQTIAGKKGYDLWFLAAYGLLICFSLFTSQTIFSVSFSFSSIHAS